MRPDRAKTPRSLPWRGLLAVLATCVLSAGLVACSTPPKPKALNELDTILGDPESRKVKDAPGATKYYRESWQYRRVALQAYNSGDISEARSYAVLGKLRYRTAAAIASQHTAKERLDQMNARVAEVNPKLQGLQAERQKLMKELVGLRSEVAQARRRRAEAERRDQARRQREAAARQVDTSGAEGEAARNQLAAAQRARDEALAVGADRFAKGTFNRASNLLVSAQQMAEEGRPADSIASVADEAEQIFGQAEEQARPAYQEELATMQPSARREGLREDAANRFGAPFVETEPDGARVILAMSFEQDQEVMRASSRPLFSAALSLAEAYPEAFIRVVGFTRKGADATGNLTLSQARARSVASSLVERGIDPSRVESIGRGQDLIRYPDEPERNDRVEIIYAIPTR